MTTTTAPQGMEMLLRTLKLPGFACFHGDVGEKAEKGGWSYTDYLRHLCEIELDERRVRRIERLRRHSCLPTDKTLATLDLSRLPNAVAKQIPSLCKGEFVDKAINVLAFGLPGRGKSHVCSAIGHELVEHGISVFFAPTYKLVQRLLGAKRDLELESEMRKLDRFDVVILDEIGYTQQDRAEMEVLFTFLAERYERKSVMITSNLVFSQWDRIFKDAMTTAAAIDRVVHHSIILELKGPSYRTEHAKKRQTTTRQKDQTTT